MPVATRILLPPSEGKADGGDGPPWERGTLALPELDVARARVLKALGRRGPRRDPTLPAIDRYTGVLYKELDAASLTATARRRLHRSTLIASGLWGVVGPSDPIPGYRLKMSASLDGLGKLSTWWRPQLTAALAPWLKGAIVWDLLPNEHAAAIAWADPAPTRRIPVRFLDRRGTTVSHWNKLLKGSIVRWLVEEGFPDPSDLADFDHPQGYRLDPLASDLTGDPNLVVLRER